MSKRLLPASLSPTVTVLLLNTNATFVGVLTTPSGEPSAPMNALLSTRFDTYCIPRGNRSVTARFVIVPSGSVTPSLYVTSSPICTRCPAESAGLFVSLVPSNVFNSTNPGLMFVAVAT